MPGLYADDFVEQLRLGAKAVASDWGLSERTDVELLTLSENATFLARDPEQPEPIILRVHRPGYHSRAEIESELDWITALRSDRVVDIPAILTRDDGNRIGAFQHGGETRNVVAFAFKPGREPDPESDLADGFRELGAISARLHQHARTWRAPDGFQRKTWNFETAFGTSPLWGDWRAALGLTEDGRRLLERLAETLERRCAAYGTAPDRFGLVHADLRLANLLVYGTDISVIDFDDCGFSWFVYDFAAAISFLETSPTIPALQAAWIEGYRTVAELGPEHVEMFPTFILFRRLLLTAWIASHAETETAEWAGHARFTDGTLDLAERYLADQS
ncbi:MAG: phosphotransferase [Pseudomonadota bacterium]